MSTSRVCGSWLRFRDMTSLSRALRVLLASATAAAALAVVPAATGSPAPVAEAASDDIVAIVVEGTGNGHGRGMSQWGAYGYAVDHGWTWSEILGHYYGGTETARTSSGQRITVRLTKYDGLSEVGVISHGSPVRWGSRSGASMRAVETSAGVFDIYSSPQIACPSATSLSVPDGPVVQSGDYNASAVPVQRFLKTFHDSGLVVDGYFGNQTNSVLASWQAAEGLPVDGTTWNQDDATRARAVIEASGSAVTWTKVGTHTQSAGDPVRFTSADGEDGGADRGDVLGVCSAAGAVNHYRGAIDVMSSSDGNRVISDVSVESYVRGVIPKEIAASWAYAGDGAGANAVRAQAVAARSYGLAQNRSYLYPGSSTSYATTCDTTACQVYGGSATRSSATGSVRNVEHVATDAAVLATANVVRKWPAGHALAGQIVSTEFSASNGPRTAGGAFPPVDDIGDSTPLNPNHRWTRIIDADTFASQHGLGSITGASTQPTTAANYQGFDGIWFDDIVITGTNGTYRRQAWDFRNAMGYRSPGMTVRVIRENTTTSSMALIGDSVGNGVTRVQRRIPPGDRRNLHVTDHRRRRQPLHHQDRLPGNDGRGRCRGVARRARSRARRTRLQRHPIGVRRRHRRHDVDAHRQGRRSRRLGEHGRHPHVERCVVLHAGQHSARRGDLALGQPHGPRLGCCERHVGTFPLVRQRRRPPHHDRRGQVLVVATRPAPGAGAEPLSRPAASHRTPRRRLDDDHSER